MKIKDLKINFRYLGGNIACLSVDSISGESVHNDINNEEAIIIFNSLVGEKADCQTVKSLLNENQELKKQVDEYKKQLKPNYYVKGLEGTLKEYQQEMNKVASQQKEFIKCLEDEIKLYNKDIQTFSKDYNVYFSLINDLKVGKTQTEEILQKYKEIIGDDK